MTIFKKPQVILFLIISFFLSLFVIRSFTTMVNVPFYDFDEAHRAENAKRMKEYNSFLVPLTGSSQDRVEHLKIPLKENSDFYLYYHLERPPLIYDLMILSTSFFGSSEWVYRLPSFILGMLTVMVFYLFAKRENPDNYFAIFVGLVSLITSSDLWLSAQYAQMDTGITFFLTLSLLTLITFCKIRKILLIYLAGIFLGLGLLSKLQPASIFVFPIIFLLITKRLSISDLIKFSIGFLLIFGPWLLYLIAKFGLKDVVFIMPGFAITSASINDIHHKAPLFWYIRWWWESLRPAWTIFLALFFYDATHGSLNWQKKVLLTYIFGGFLAFSIPTNKLWWYMLPLIPALSYYIYLSVNDYLQKEPGRIGNLSFAIILASLPLFLQSSNLIVMIYGILITGIVFLILIDKLSIKINLGLNKKFIFYIAIILSLGMFSLQFPKIIPYHLNTKEVALYYKNLPYPKCLWLGDMPGEAVLFYSNAGEVPILNENLQIFSSCPNNYLITPNRFKEGKRILRRGNIRLYQLTDQFKRIDELP